MKTQTPYKCDICGKVRNEVNHWYIFEPCIEGGYVVNRWADIERIAPLIIDEDTTKHICGQQCAHKLLEEFMSTTGCSDQQPLEAQKESK